MMVSLSMIDNQGIDLNLPGANSAKSQDQTDHTQTVSVAKSGELFLNKEPITLSMFAGKIQSAYRRRSGNTSGPTRRLRLLVWTRRRGLRQRPHARIEQVGNSNGPSGASVIPMSFEGAASFRWRPWLCQALSVALHAAFFLAGGFLLTVAAEFGVDAGTGGHAPTEPQEMHAEVEIVEYETTPKVLPVVEEPVVTEEPARER